MPPRPFVAESLRGAAARGGGGAPGGGAGLAALRPPGDGRRRWGGIFVKKKGQIVGKNPRILWKIPRLTFFLCFFLGLQGCYDQ